MRGLELAKVAAAAEMLRLRRLARRQAIRAGLAVGALLFALAAFAMLNSVCYLALSLVVSPWLAAAIVFAVDLVVAGAVVAIAIRSTPGPIESEAVAIRRQALAEIEPTLNVVSLMQEAGGLALSVRRALRGQKIDRLILLADAASRFARLWSAWRQPPASTAGLIASGEP